MIEADRLTVLNGEPVAFQGAACHRAQQCPECRSTLWSFHPRLGEAIAFVGVGILDEGERLPPEAPSERIARALAKAGTPLPASRFVEG